MGVTGTLESLTAGQKQLLEQEYKVRRLTFMPSVYGPNNLIFQGDRNDGGVGVRLENSGSLHNAIFEHAVEPILGGRAGERAALIFFATSKELKAFQESPAMRAVRNPLCSPFELPPDKYEVWKTVTVTFDPSQMF